MHGYGCHSVGGNFTLEIDRIFIDFMCECEFNEI